MHSTPNYYFSVVSLFCYYFGHSNKLLFFSFMQLTVHSFGICRIPTAKNESTEPTASFWQCTELLHFSSHFYVDSLILIVLRLAAMGFRHVCCSWSIIWWDIVGIVIIVDWSSPTTSLDKCNSELRKRFGDFYSKMWSLSLHQLCIVQTHCSITCSISFVTVME